jgi:carbonic anhydrase/acetyltransferase-like protein (isoleucine patch superfamily)
LQSIHESVFIATQVQLYGRITIGEGSSIWPNCVIRAEAQSVEIGRYTNIQDFVMAHVGYDHPTSIGDFCSITHHATVHGCVIEDQCLIGINAVIMDGAVIGRGSIVAGGAMVTEGSVFAPGSIIAGVPAKKIKERENRRDNRLNAWQYHRNAQAYLRGDHRGWSGPEYETWLSRKREELKSDLDLAALANSEIDRGDT